MKHENSSLYKHNNQHRAASNHVFAGLFTHSFGRRPKNIKLNNPNEMQQYNRITSLVRKMLEMHVELDTSKGHEKVVLQRQIDATAKEIDRLVYELYGLTEEEIKIVEGESSK